MKKQMVKLITLVLVIALGCAAINVIADDSISETEMGSEISPCFTALLTCTVGLDKENNAGKVYVDASTVSYPAYTATVKAELQHYDGDWYTIKTWNDNPNNTIAGIGEYYYVGTGSYRVKSTHKAFNSNGTVAETFTAYSDEITF